MRHADTSTRADQRPSGVQGSRADVIIEAIRQAVVEHRILPGTRLSEDQIGLLFGASRTIVRTALQRLAHDHIVTLAKNRGASVAAPSITDARDLFDARRSIEGLIVRRAAGRMTKAAEGRLADLIARGQRALATADRGLAIRLSGEFHLEIAATAGQPILQSFLLELVSRSSLVIALYGRSGTADCSAADHRALLAALRAGDGDTAATLMRDHLAHIEGDLDLSKDGRTPVALRDALLMPAPAANEERPGS